MKMTAHILIEVETDPGVTVADVARNVAVAAERAAEGVRGDGVRAVNFSVATSAMDRAALHDALERAAGVTR